ncbi:MAG TPA: cytochrome c oxidase assembly protein [Dehalococcoidia bacterium]
MILLHANGQELLNWHVHPETIVLCAGLLVCYWYALQVWRPRLPEAGPVTRSHVTFFSLGVLTLFIAGGSPVHDISEEHLLSMHTVQLLLFALVAPPLLLAGIPTWLYRAVLERRFVLPVANVVLNPLIAIFAFNMTLVIIHLPHVFDYQLRSESFHFFVHVWTVAVALMMWWPIITRVPGLPQLSYPYQMAYLFVQSLVPAVIGSFITFSHTAVYEFYEQAPPIWGLDPVEDQQLAAFIMKVVGSLILWGFIGFAFFRWFAEEESRGRGLPWTEAKEEPRPVGLNPNR